MTIISRHTVDELNGEKKIELEREFITKRVFQLLDHSPR